MANSVEPDQMPRSTLLAKACLSDNNGTNTVSVLL